MAGGWLENYGEGKGWETTGTAPWSPEETANLTDEDYVWKTLQTCVSFPFNVIREHGNQIVALRMEQELLEFQRKMKHLMGPYVDEPDSHRGVQSKAEWNYSNPMKVAYEVYLRSTLKVYLPRLEEYNEACEREENEEMPNGRGLNPASFVFMAMAVETPEQWEQVEAVPGELFQLPKVVLPLETVVAKDQNTAHKQTMKKASAIDGVDIDRLEVMVWSLFR